MEKQHTFNILHELVKQKEWKSLLIIFLFAIVRLGIFGGAVGSSGAYMINASGNSSSQVIQSSPKTVATIENNLLNEKPIEAVKGAEISIDDTISFNEEDWNLSGLKKEKDSEGKFTGYVCAKKRDGFEMSEMWHKDKGMKVGEILRMRYSMKKTKEWNEQGDYSPKLVLLYGKKNNGEVYYRMFIPDEDPDRIGFEDNSGSRKTWPKSKLDKTLNVVDGGEISLEYEVNGSNSNSAAFNFKLNYIADTGTEEGGVKEIKYEDSFPTRLPWPSPHNKGAEQDFGIGIYPETCIKILSYENPANISH